MNLSKLLSKIFEKFPEIPFKNKMRYFLAFNKLVPNFISDISPLKGYVLYYSLKPGDIVVDAGAFTGDYTIYAAKKVGKKGKILAFEPDAKNRKILEKNIKSEKLENIIIIPKGLWDENTTLFLNPSNLSSKLSKNKKYPSVQVVRLDDEVIKLKINKIDFIKMDIEGAEINAIKGCVNVIRKFKPRFAIASYHIVNDKRTSIFLESFLFKEGYFVKSDFLNHLTTYAWMKS